METLEEKRKKLKPWSILLFICVLMYLVVLPIYYFTLDPGETEILVFVIVVFVVMLTTVPAFIKYLSCPKCGKYMGPFLYKHCPVCGDKLK
jgi:hypothetical protein